MGFFSSTNEEVRREVVNVVDKVRMLEKVIDKQNRHVTNLELDIEDIEIQHEMEISRIKSLHKIEKEVLKVDYENEARQCEMDAILKERAKWEKERVDLIESSCESLNNETEARAKYEELDKVIAIQDGHIISLKETLDKLIEKLPTKFDVNIEAPKVEVKKDK